MKKLKLIILIIVMSFCGYKILEKNRQKENAKEIISARIEQVKCQSKYLINGRRNTIRSKLSVNFDDNVYTVLIPTGPCKEVKVGEMINLFYSEKDDLLFFNKKIKQNEN